jgi:hypothetical protein
MADGLFREAAVDREIWGIAVHFHNFIAAIGSDSARSYD